MDAWVKGVRAKCDRLKTQTEQLKLRFICNILLLVSQAGPLRHLGGGIVLSHPLQKTWGQDLSPDYLSIPRRTPGPQCRWQILMRVDRPLQKRCTWSPQGALDSCRSSPGFNAMLKTKNTDKERNAKFFFFFFASLNKRPFTFRCSGMSFFNGLPVSWSTRYIEENYQYLRLQTQACRECGYFSELGSVPAVASPWKQTLQHLPLVAFWRNLKKWIKTAFMNGKMRQKITQKKEKWKLK